MKNILKCFCCGFLTFYHALQACMKCRAMGWICLLLGKARSENIFMITAVGKRHLESLGGPCHGQPTLGRLFRLTFDLMYKSGLRALSSAVMLSYLVPNGIELKT